MPDGWFLGFVVPNWGCAFHVEVETCSVDVFCFAGIDVESDADAFAVSKGDGDDGFGLIVGARRWFHDGHVEGLFGLLDEAVEEGGGTGVAEAVFHTDVYRKRHGWLSFFHENVFFVINKVKNRGFRLAARF